MTGDPMMQLGPAGARNMYLLEQKPADWQMTQMIGFFIQDFVCIEHFGIRKADAT